MAIKATYHYYGSEYFYEIDQEIGRFSVSPLQRIKWSIQEAEPKETMARSADNIREDPPSLSFIGMSEALKRLLKLTVEMTAIVLIVVFQAAITGVGFPQFFYTNWLLFVLVNAFTALATFQSTGLMLRFIDENVKIFKEYKKGKKIGKWDQFVRENEEHQAEAQDANMTEGEKKEGGAEKSAEGGKVDD